MPITFTTTGFRYITVEVTDQHGAVGSDSILVNVIEPPSTSPPIVSILRPIDGSEYLDGARATLDFDALDPAGSTPTFSDVEWQIRAPEGTFQPVTVRTSLRVRPGRDPETVHSFVPSDYVTPRCNPTFSPANAATLRLSYTNEVGLTGTDEVQIYVAIPPSDCVN